MVCFNFRLITCLQLLVIFVVFCNAKITLPKRDTTYNFIKKSLPYDTKNKLQIILLNNFMNDVLGYKSLTSWENILQCHSENLPKSLLCYACISDYYVALENLELASQTITEGYEYMKTLQTTKGNL